VAFELRVSQPVGGVVTAPGKLAEPLVIAPTDDSLRLAADDLRSARETTAIVTAAGCPAG